MTLSETTGYPTKNAKIFAVYLPISLFTSWSYTTSLAFAHLKELPFTFLCGFTSPAATSDVYEPSLSFSMHTLYTDSSFHDATDSSSPSMTSAWLALDDDGFILESSFISLSFCLLSALRSEIYAIILSLRAFPSDSSVTNIFTDCIQLISL